MCIRDRHIPRRMSRTGQHRGGTLRRGAKWVGMCAVCPQTPHGAHKLENIPPGTSVDRAPEASHRVDRDL
eukprot:90264-Prymnesium_polylepis.1